MLDELTHGRLWRHAPTIDARHIAVVGHSLGGAAAATTIVDDPRVDAGINLDGTFHVDFPEAGMDRPFLMLGGASHEEGASDGADWPNNLVRLGAGQWLQVPTGGRLPRPTRSPCDRAQNGLSDVVVRLEVVPGRRPVLATLGSLESSGFCVGQRLSVLAAVGQVWTFLGLVDEGDACPGRAVDVVRLGSTCARTSRCCSVASG